MGDSRITEVFPNNIAPAWSPSFSQDGSIVTFTKDESGLFNNYEYANLSYGGVPGPDTDEYLVFMSDKNFDMYRRNWADDTEYFASKVTSSNLQAFMKWAPEGGDKMVNSIYENLVNRFKMNIFTDFDNNISGDTNKAGETMTKFADHSGSSIAVPGDPAEYGYKKLRVEPVMKKIPSPEGYKYFGASRIVISDPRNSIFPDGTQLTLSYRRSSISGIDMDNYKLALYYVKNGKLEKVDAQFVNNDSHGYAFAEVSKQGTYTVLAIPKASAFENLDSLRVWPNPFVPSELEKDGVTTPVLVFDRLPDTIEDITVYNVAGEKVANVDDDSITYVNEGTTLALDAAYTYDVTGAAAKWDLTNSDTSEIASGVYIVVFTMEDGTTEFKKVAVIK